VLIEPFHDFDVIPETYVQMTANNDVVPTAERRTLDRRILRRVTAFHPLKKRENMRRVMDWLAEE